MSEGDWPKDEVAVADEKTTLLRFLHHQRQFLLRKAEGLTEEQMRTASCPPSDLTMLGLIRHLTDVERGWGQRAVGGQNAPPLYYSDEDPDGDFQPPDDATSEMAIARFKQMIEEVEPVYAAAELDDMEDHERAFYSVRWILVHLIEEYARHLGHADLIRQAIDGQVGE